MRAISHELLSRPVLERVVARRRPGRRRVDGRRDRRDSRPQRRSRCRRRWRRRAVPGPDTFLVTYVGRTPGARRSASPTGSPPSFIEQHSKLRETRAEDTSAFLAAQLDQSQERLQGRSRKVSAR